MCNEIVGVNGDEGTPVPIPNTVVKLVYGDNTWLATAREDNSTPTSKAATKVAAFSFYSKKTTSFCLWGRKSESVDWSTREAFCHNEKATPAVCGWRRFYAPLGAAVP